MPLDQKTIGVTLTVVAVTLLVLLTMVKIGTDNQSVFLCEAVEADPGLTMSDCPAHTNPISWVLVVTFGIAFLILGAGIYLLLIPLQHKLRSKIDIGKLDDDERVLYELLVRNSGMMYQSRLAKEAGFSKVKTTRVLDKMEQKKMLKRERRGMTNRVVLK